MEDELKEWLKDQITKAHDIVMEADDDLDAISESTKATMMYGFVIGYKHALLNVTQMMNGEDIDVPLGPWSNIKKTVTEEKTWEALVMNKQPDVSSEKEVSQ